MVKVLYVMDWLLRQSGITSFAMNYFRHIDRNRVQIDFLVLSNRSEEAILNEIREKGSDVYCVPILEKNNIWISLHCLKDFFREHHGEYPIIHSHIFQLDCILFYFAKHHGVKICISHAHVTKWSDYKLRAIRNSIMAFPLPYYADVWSACSVEAGMFLYGSGFVFSPKRWVIHNAIEVKKFIFNGNRRETVRKEFGYTNEIVLGNVGRLEPQKNQTFLLDILKTLLDKGQLHYRLLIVGEGTLYDGLREKAKRLGVSEYITFAGERSDIPEMLWAMDIFLFPSLYEGLGIAGIEAQTAGLPCLFSEWVPQEAAVMDVQYLPIDKGAKVWVDFIKQIDLTERKFQVEAFVKAGYDIYMEAEKVARNYESLAQG